MSLEILQSISPKDNIEEINIGTQEKVQNIKISTSLAPEVKDEYLKLLRKYKDVFAWSYADLKTYDTSLIKHKIPLKYEAKPYQQKLRRINPILLPTIEKELKKMLDAHIILPLRYSNWISNLVPVRKKNGETRLCVDFRNLNKASLKDNYPLPKMDQLLQQVFGANRLSMLDGFSGYNQIMVDKEDREKTSFTTPWGTFMYARMPFGLTNPRDTFQRAMDIAFVGQVNKFLVIYLDDLTVYSNSNKKHLKHLMKVFERCRKFGISLNSKKSLFVITEGKFLGHIISKDGVVIDPNKVSIIQTLSLPRNKKEVQAFLGKINFLRRFIPNYAEIIKDITDMLKKGHEIKWTVSSRHAFDEIKKAIFEAPTLASPDYTKPFNIFSFASETTLVVVLLQKNEDSHDQPIAFFSKVTRDVGLKYDIIEKQAYALVQSLKYLRMYVLHSTIIAYVPKSVVKIVLTQPDTDGRRDIWVTQILEFYLTIKTTKLVKGQRLAKLLPESNCKVLGINSVMEILGENPQEPSQNPNEKNPQEPFVYAKGENPQEPSQHPEEKNPQEPLPSD